jgi:uncharacterized membrane protein YdjX (TVP38/TMEM64 family)
MGLIIGLAGAVISACILYAIIQGAVHSGVRRALREHHEWLHPEDRD